MGALSFEMIGISLRCGSIMGKCRPAVIILERKIMNNWLLSLILGILAIIFGIVALSYPFATSAGVLLFTGWSFIVFGIVAIIAAFTGNESNGRIWSVVLGILMIITGFVLLRNPLAGILAISMVVAIVMLVTGIAKFIGGWKINNTSLKWLTIISGVASIILAFLVFSYPVASLGILVAVELIVDGVALTALAFARKSGGVSA